MEQSTLVDRDIKASKPDRSEDNELINNELSELRKYVKVIASTICDMEAPVTRTSDQLTQATVHLNDLAKMTEEITHRVLALTEAIETNRGAIQAGLENLEEKFSGEHATDVESLVEMVKTDERRLMDLHVALSFQDLLAQRVGKLVTILNDVQHTLLKLVVIFGIKQKKDGISTKDGRRGNEMLRQLEASQPRTHEQSHVDDTLMEF